MCVDRPQRHGPFRGEPMAAAWLVGWSAGATVFGFLSCWSRWPEVLLAPAFLAAGVLTAVGARCRHRAAGTLGLGVMVIASWSRAVALWGIDQHGAGSDYLASAAWVWISLMCLIAMVVVARRGVEQ